MFKYLLHKYLILYFILITYLIFFCHTVVSTSAPGFLQKNELYSKENKTEHVKRGEKNQDSTKTGIQSRNTNTSDEKSVPQANVTIARNVLPSDDMFNSTGHLPPWMLNIRDGALQRTGYVALGFMSIVVFFFVIRAVRLRHKKSKSRKYGIITSTVSDMEMEPLDKDDDEEEDTTLFDAQHKYSLQ